jgi:hypothetical protein
MVGTLCIAGVPVAALWELCASSEANLVAYLGCRAQQVGWKRGWSKATELLCNCALDSGLNSCQGLLLPAGKHP